MLRSTFYALDETNGDFGRKTQTFPTAVFNTSLEIVTLEFIAAFGRKKN